METQRQVVVLNVDGEDRAMLDEIAERYEGNRSMGARFVFREYRRLLELEAAMRGSLVDSPSAYVVAGAEPAAG